jgi:DNA methylase
MLPAMAMVQNIRTEGAAAELARALAGRRSDHGWVARCPAHTDRHPSLSIADGADGRLLLCCFAGCSWSEIRTALEARSLWPGREGYSPFSARACGVSQGRRSAGHQPDKLAVAKRIWRNAIPAPGTEVEIYLQSRSLTTPVPPTLRYARLRHRESGLWLPCMVAAVQAAEGRLSGLHRTFLRLDGRGKADFDPVKKMLGACRGGAVRLAPAGRRLALCEGIETGLSIREACSDLAVWCALTLGRADYQRQYEPILYGWPASHDRYWCGARDQGDVWFVDKPARNDLHPTMKPVALVERALRNSSKTRDIVLDPFGGSGSTLIACAKSGRQARLVELDPRYCDVIVRRWQEWSGAAATLKGNDQTFAAIASARQAA